MGYVQLALFGLIPVALAVVFRLLQSTKFFSKIPAFWAQIIIGVAFGLYAVGATEFGVQIEGSIMNVRDAGPIIAGLIFGLPAGLVSGAIGGIERIISVLWKDSYYTMLACSISTFISGLVSGLLNKYVFKGRPKWYQALLIGLVLETIHILSIFLFNMNDAHKAFNYVQKIANGMISANGTSVMVAVLIFDIWDAIVKKSKVFRKGKLTLSNALQIGLYSATVFGFIFTFIFINRILIQNSIADTKEELISEVDAATAMVKEISDNSMLDKSHSVKNQLESTTATITNELLREYASDFVLSEVNIFDENGTITYSTIDAYVGATVYDGPQIQKWAILLDSDIEDHVEPFEKSTHGDWVKYAGTSLAAGGFVQVGYYQDLYYDVIGFTLSTIANNMVVGDSGYMILANGNETIVGGNPQLIGKTFEQIGLDPDAFSMFSQKTIMKGKIDNESVQFTYLYKEGYYILSVLTQAEIDFQRDMVLHLTNYQEFVVFSLLFLIAYILVDKIVINDFNKVNRGLSKIANGHLDEQVDAHKTIEFTEVSTSINKTVDKLKEFIDREAKRIDDELALAKNIQTSSLPAMYSYLSMHEFDVFGKMDTAKQVGGDFYDFFTMPNNRVAVVIADVSGKGIPAALFMMKTKSLIKSLAETGLSVDEIFNRANRTLNEGNDSFMFVTAWMGILDLKTGVMEYVNAGHNPPVFKTNGVYTYIESKPNFILGPRPNIKYEKQTIQFKPGDAIVLYTDGVTEAVRTDQQLYGEQRLLSFLNKTTIKDPEKLCNAIIDEVHNFVNGNEQSDDITVNVLSFNGAVKHYEIDVEGRVENLETVIEQLDKVLEDNNQTPKMITNMNIVAEELFVNIASYGYKDMDVGRAIIHVDINDTQVNLTFFDRGHRFNPLTKEDPDITLPAKERQIGGLGVFMVKKIMDRLHYSYQNRLNILNLTKYIEEDKKHGN